MRAYERGLTQLGTLGSGNHFLKVQYVDEIYDEETAEVFGLQEGGVTVLIHTGSRGFGHQVCTDYVERFLEVAPKVRHRTDGQELASAPRARRKSISRGCLQPPTLHSPIGPSSPTSYVRPDVAGHAGHGLKVLYRAAHNNAKFEKHGWRVLVHRKGTATVIG